MRGYRRLIQWFLSVMAVYRSEEPELLPHVTNDFLRGDFEHVEAHRLAQRTALANNHNITFLDVEGRRAVG